MEVASGKIKPSGGIDLSVADLFRAWEEYSTEGRTKIRGSDDEKESLLRMETDVGHGKKPTLTYGQKLKWAFLSFYIPFKHLIQDVFYYILDVLLEFIDLIKRSLFFCMKDPIRETPSVFTSFTLLFKRACLQLYRNRTQFLMDQLLHIGCGAFISLAASNFTYIGKAPVELCTITPFVVIPFCLMAKDTLQVNVYDLSNKFNLI